MGPPVCPLRFKVQSVKQESHPSEEEADDKQRKEEQKMCLTVMVLYVQLKSLHIVTKEGLPEMSFKLKSERQGVTMTSRKIIISRKHSACQGLCSQLRPP